MLISLTDVPLFAGLSAEQCAELQSRMATLEFPPMAEVMREGARGNTALLTGDIERDQDNIQLFQTQIGTVIANPEGFGFVRGDRTHTL